MVHIESVLVYDFPPVVAAVASVMAAKIGSKNHKQLKAINAAVNDVNSPEEPTIKEDVKAIRQQVESK